MYVLTKSLSLTNILLCLLFDITASQDFSSSDNVDISIQRCTLNVNWTSEKADSCINLNYRVKLYQNETEIATIDTTALWYSKDGIDSVYVYRIEITPMLRCRNNSNFNGRRRVKSISSIPDRQSEYITKNISENVALECPLSGAYQPLKVEWQHILGINSTVVRTYTTQVVNLQRVSYKDMGRYICTIEYTTCGTSISTEKSRNFVTLSVNGPPFISSSQETVSVSLGENLTLELNVISFPPPNSLVVIKNFNGLDIFREMVSFRTRLTPLQAFGKIIEVQGYNTKLYLMNISQDWIGANRIIVFNGFGNHSFKITFYNYSDKEKNNFFVNFLRENTILLTGVGGGVLLLIIVVIVAVIIWDIRRKQRQKNITLNGNHNQQGEAENLTTVPSSDERIYARPFSFGNNNNGKATTESKRLTDREKQIELERRQCASMYSYGGFSVNEFQDDEIMYDNQFAPEYK